MTREPLPVGTIGGFLGAGKTTLVNHLLKHANGRRLVVLVNDFGDLDIDHALVETVEADRVSLRNGCVCCTLNGELVDVIANYARASDPPDGVLLEASGVADPRGVDDSLDALEAAGLARREARIYVLDADCFPTLGYDQCEELVEHAAASDLVLLNKADLAPESARRALRATLAESAPFSTAVETRFSRIDPALALCLPSRPPRPRPVPAALHAAQTGHAAERFSAWSFESPLTVDRARLAAALRELPTLCFRAKGLLRFSDSPEREHVLHQVGYRATVEQRRTCSVGERAAGVRVVAIGKLDTTIRTRLEGLFAAVLAEDR